MKRFLVGIYWLITLICIMRVEQAFCQLDETNDKKFVVVVCCYNNIEWVQKNLDSIFTQQYPFFRLIFVDDASNDGTGEFVQQYVTDHNLTDRVTLLRNTQRRRKLSNLYRALYLCDDDEIVILIDGDDWLVSGHVFSYINKLYQDPYIWFTYGQYKNEPVSEAQRWGFREMGYAAELPQNIIEESAHRKHKFVFMHLRTFYAWLFKLVKLQDLIATTVPGYAGDFYPASNDLAMYYPIAEMAHDHIHFVPHVLYIRNLYSQIVGFKVDKLIQRTSAKEIRKKTPYKPVDQPIYRDLERYKQATADLIIFSHNNSINISHVIDAVRQKVAGIRNITVIYNKTKAFRATIDDLRTAYPEVCCVGYDQYNLQEVALHQIKQSKAEHLFFANDTLMLYDTVDVGHMIYWLERTYAHAFYLDRDVALYANKAPQWLVPIDEDVCAWKFHFGRGVWRNIHSLSLTLYRRSFVQEMISKIEFDSVADFENALQSYQVPVENIGLFYHTAKVAQTRMR